MAPLKLVCFLLATLAVLNEGNAAGHKIKHKLPRKKLMQQKMTIPTTETIIGHVMCHHCLGESVSFLPGMVVVVECKDEQATLTFNSVRTSDENGAFMVDLPSNTRMNRCSAGIASSDHQHQYQSKQEMRIPRRSHSGGDPQLVYTIPPLVYKQGPRAENQLFMRRSLKQFGGGAGGAGGGAGGFGGGAGGAGGGAGGAGGAGGGGPGGGAAGGFGGGPGGGAGGAGGGAGGAGGGAGGVGPGAGAGGAGGAGAGGNGGGIGGNFGGAGGAGAGGNGGGIGGNFGGAGGNFGGAGGNFGGAGGNFGGAGGAGGAAGGAGGGGPFRGGAGGAAGGGGPFGGGGGAGGFRGGFQGFPFGQQQPAVVPAPAPGPGS